MLKPVPLGIVLAHVAVCEFLHPIRWLVPRLYAAAAEAHLDAVEAWIATDSPVDEVLYRAQWVKTLGGRVLKGKIRTEHGFIDAYTASIKDELPGNIFRTRYTTYRVADWAVPTEES